MGGEYPWHLRPESELSALRKLAFSDGRQSVTFRLDGWEITSPGEFIDLHVWADGASTREALWRGQLEPFNVMDLAGWFLDVASGARQEFLIGLGYGNSSLVARRTGEDGAVLSFKPMDPVVVLSGSPDWPSVTVSDSDLVQAAVWLCVEARRFMSPELMAHWDWVPEGVESRADDLVKMRRAYVEAQPKTHGEAFAEMKMILADALDNPDFPPSQRPAIERVAKIFEANEPESGAEPDEEPSEQV